MAATWLWLKGIPGPPQNDEWFSVRSWSFGRSRLAQNGFGGGGSEGRVVQANTIAFTVPYDSSSSQFFAAIANGQVMELASLFVEPQKEWVFNRCTFNSVASGDGKNAPLNCSLTYESVE